MPSEAMSGEARVEGGEGDWLALARRGQTLELARQAQQGRSTAGWSAARALELALAWLLAGELRQADLALLEADQLDPSLGLVPDVWGLWPAPPASRSAGRQQALALAERFQRWRHPHPQSLWQELRPQLQANWRSALEPPVGDGLLILGRATAEPDVAQLDPPLEATLAPLVADAEIAAEPAASSRFWQRLATIRPHWALARIRAADLTLARGEWEASERWLADPPASARRNPWFHDVSARQALARGDVEAALLAWDEAIQCAETQDDANHLISLFAQRRQEARRGPGVLQVRSLANRGERDRALALLARLLEEDPQWQPLRHLREQLNTRSAPPAPAASPAPAPAEDAAGHQGDIQAVLDRAAARLRALGVAIPSAAAAPAAEGQELASELAALERRFSEFEARFALA
jgi:hypothetical protein